MGVKRLQTGGPFVCLTEENVSHTSIACTEAEEISVSVTFHLPNKCRKSFVKSDNNLIGWQRPGLFDVRQDLLLVRRNVLTAHV